MHEESSDDEAEMDEGEGDNEEPYVIVIGGYGEEEENRDDRRYERGMDRCECEWEVTSTVIVQGMEGVRRTTSNRGDREDMFRIR